MPAFGSPRPLAGEGLGERGKQGAIILKSYLCWLDLALFLVMCNKQQYRCGNHEDNPDIGKAQIYVISIENLPNQPDEPSDYTPK